MCFFLIVVMMIFQCEHEHSVCSKAYNLVTETRVFHLVQYYESALIMSISMSIIQLDVTFI